MHVLSSNSIIITIPYWVPKSIRSFCRFEDTLFSNNYLRIIDEGCGDVAN